MPIIYLSPSTQENNYYVTGGTEEYYMNLLADAMVPYLISNGIQYVRNTPDMTAGSSIRQANRGNYDLYLALHSNASPEALAGRQRGVDIYYFPASEEGLRMANILVDNLKPIYPLPERVRALPTVLIGEVRRTKAPSVLAELGYHDNVEDADWLTGNLEEIAAALSEGVTEYFGLPSLTPSEPRTGIVTLSSGTLNLRSLPTTDAAVLAQLPNGATVTILGQFDEWYTVEYDGLHGFASSRYITVL